MLFAFILLAFTAPIGEKPLVAVPFERVTIKDPFFAPRIATNRRVTVPTCLARCEETGRLRNFDVAAGRVEGKHEGERYNDSDVYKVLEGIAYTLRAAPDAALEARADAIIDSIAAAQREDGYLNTYYQLVAPDKRWADIRHGHELYCGGHLIEAGVAYAQATGKNKLLDVATRFADLVAKEFGPKKRLDPCGHPEIELALVKLARATGEKRYVDLARFFVEQRGRKEGRAELFGEYAQDHKPVREQKEAVGHAVRAMYLYCAMADVAAETGDATLLAPLEALWKDVVERKMYVTGGIGSSADNEGFTKAFDLPNDRAYCETCASIGMALWSQRMFLLTRDAKYADLVELQSYNVIPAAVSLSGDRFFYGNPMESDGTHRREPWYRTACCPTNLVRYLPAMGERIYATDGEALYIAQYIASEADVEIAGTKVRVSIDTQYPWGDRNRNVRLTIAPEKPIEFAVHIRVPFPGMAMERTKLEQGVLVPCNDQFFGGARGAEASSAHWQSFRRPWRADAPVSFRVGSPGTASSIVDARNNPGRKSYRSGPIVYAFEAIDQPLPLNRLSVRAWIGYSQLEEFGADLQLPRFALRADGVDEIVEGIAVPYALWGNRKPGAMRVWMP